MWEKDSCINVFDKLLLKTEKKLEYLKNIYISVYI